jgi:hypothetical protein
MPRYQFALSSIHQVREAGVVQSESFSDALSAISEHVSAHEGDTLEIGVNGFPPARYECVWSSDRGTSTWRPTGQLAA